MEGCQQKNGLHYNTHAAEVTGKFNLTGQSVLLLQDRGLGVTVVLIKLPYISVCFLGKICIDPVWCDKEKALIRKGIIKRLNVTTSYLWSQLICYIVVLKVLKLEVYIEIYFLVPSSGVL